MAAPIGKYMRIVLASNFHSSRPISYASCHLFGGICSPASRECVVTSEFKMRIEKNRYFHTSNINSNSNQDINKDKKFVYSNITRPSIFGWFKRLKQNFLMRNTVDPDFTLDEFIYGAKQAISLVLKNVSEKNFESLQDLVSPGVVDYFKENVEKFNTEQMETLNVDLENMSIAEVKRVEIHRIDDSGMDGHFRAEITVYAIAFHHREVDSDKAFGGTSGPFKFKLTLPKSAVELIARFSRDYQRTESKTSESMNDWIISQVKQFNVTDFKNMMGL